MPNLVLIALTLTFLAGLATTIGSFLGLIYKNPSPRFMSAALGFSAGVMIIVSFVELLPAAVNSIGFLCAYAGFFAGMAFIFLMDFLIPHEYIGQTEHKNKMPPKLLRSGLFVALGIGVHNFAEGIATFAGTLKDLHLGIVVAIAIALHNIPEGLVVSVPVYAATNSRRKAFWWSFLSGVTEPLSAVIAAVFLLPFLSPQLIGWMLASVAGVMMYLSFDELIPLSNSFGEEHSPILGLIVGMIVMVISLWMLRLVRL